MARVVFGAALVALCVCMGTAVFAAGNVLFPKSLHLSRQVDDPITGTTVTIDEYCFGNRIVSVAGDRTVIVDYDKQQVTEIDRRAGTYSISRFDEVASAAELAAASSTRSIATDVAKGGPTPDRWQVTPRGVGSSAYGRSVEQFEFAQPAGGRKVEVGVDRSVQLSVEAIEVLIGAAYPNPRRDEHEPLLRAAGASEATRAISANRDAKTGEPQSYALPVMQATTYSDSGTEVTFRTTVTRIGAEAVPPEMLLIPPAAKQVESKAASLKRQLRDLDLPNSQTTTQQP